MNQKLISKYIVKAIEYVIRINHQSYRYVSDKLNISYKEFKQLMSNQSFTNTEIYAFSRLEHVSVDDLFPPIKNDLNGFKRFQLVTGKKSKDEFTKFLNSIK